MCGCNRDFIDDRIRFRFDFDRCDRCDGFDRFDRFDEFDGCCRHHRHHRHCGICNIFRRRHHCCDRDCFR